MGTQVEFQEMNHRLDRIEEKLDKLQESLVQISVKHEARLTTLEVRQKGIITIGGAFMVALITGLLNKLGFNIT